MQVEKRHIKCPHCGHEWNTKSQRIYTSCPNCRYNVHLQKNISPFQGLEHFNIDEKGVKILDRTLKDERSPHGIIVEVHFKQGHGWCDYDNSNECRHTQFALSLPIVQDIFKKKGWKLT